MFQHKIRKKFEYPRCYNVAGEITGNNKMLLLLLQQDNLSLHSGECWLQIPGRRNTPCFWKFELFTDENHFEIERNWDTLTCQALIGLFGALLTLFFLTE